MIDWWQAILFGIVEGVTEFLPISSTGHLTVMEGLLGYSVADPSVTAFTAIIQVGAMVASIIYFWSDIVRFATGWFRGLAKAEHRSDPDYKMGWAIIVGFLITGIVAFALKDLVEGPLRNLWAVVIGLIGWSLVMMAADRLAKAVRKEDSITWADGALIGLVQVISLVPGVSRSGATISTGLFRGLDRVAATRMSFFIGIPTLVASGGFQALTQADAIGTPGGVGWLATVIGTVVSGIVAYFSIAWLLKFVSRNDFTGFIVYRVLLGLVLAGLLVAGVIPAV